MTDKRIRELAREITDSVEAWGSARYVGRHAADVIRRAVDEAVKEAIDAWATAHRQSVDELVKKEADERVAKAVEEREACAKEYGEIIGVAEAALIRHHEYAGCADIPGTNPEDCSMCAVIVQIQEWVSDLAKECGDSPHDDGPKTKKAG